MSIQSDELEKCLEDVHALLPRLHLKRESVLMAHVGRLPTAKSGRLLDTAVIRKAPDNPSVTSVVAVKYTMARQVARSALARLSASQESKAASLYGASTDPADCLEELENNWESRSPHSTLQRLVAEYGDIARLILVRANETSDHSGFEQIPGTDGIRAEIDYVLDHEHVFTLSDYIRRRSGIGALRCPPAECLRYCARVMAERLGWSEARRENEIAQVVDAYDLAESESPGSVERQRGG